MSWDPATRALTFSSDEEVEAFHAQLSVLVRQAMMNATRHEPDAQRAKDLSREVMKELAAVMRALNALRAELTPKAY